MNKIAKQTNKHTIKKMNKKAYTWWQYIGAAILIIITLFVAIAIMKSMNNQSFSIIDKIFGFL